MSHNIRAACVSILNTIGPSYFRTERHTVISILKLYLLIVHKQSYTYTLRMDPDPDLTADTYKNKTKKN